MLPPSSPHLTLCPSLQSWTIAILLAASSLACGDDDPFTAGLTPSEIVIISGDAQAGRVSQVLPEPLVVRVLDEFDRPFTGVTVAWAAQGGSVDPETVVTDAEGHAAVSRVLGPSAGDQTTTATVSGLQPVTFTSRALVEE